MSGRLEGKIALVTGAARGIGLAIARRFCEEGAQVVAADIEDASSQSTHVDGEGRVESLHLDVSDSGQWQAVMAHVEQRWQRLDILVNNAGILGTEISTLQDPEHYNEAMWQRVHAVNLNGVALGCKHAIALMKKQRGGSIVNISSRYGLIGAPDMAAYASSKAAVRNHTKSVALYCARRRYHIRCNSIHPGPIATSMWDDLPISADGIPLGRLGAAIDVAQAALYLASDESAFVTGAELVVDGGLLAAGGFLPRASQ